MNRRSDPNIVALRVHLRTVRPCFETACQPQALRAAARALNEEIGSDLFFRVSECKWVGEALTLGEFAYAIGAESACIAARDPPDGFVTIRGRTFPVEIVEIQRPGRRRGDEYKENNPRASHFDMDDGSKEHAFIMEMYRQRDRKLAMRGYPKDTMLLMLANRSGIGAFGGISPRLALASADMNSIVEGPITRVCVMMGDVLFGPSDIVPDGRLRFDVPA